MAPNPPSSLRVRLVAEMVRYLGSKEEPKGSNRSVLIDYWLTTVGSPLGSPWCAACIWTLGIQATGRALWPVKMSGSVQAIVDAAVKDGTFTKDAALARPGDLAVFYYPALNRYGHIAVVEHVPAKGRCRTLDGNSAPDAKPGSPADREGYCITRKDRPLTDRVGFIRWGEK